MKAKSKKKKNDAVRVAVIHGPNLNLLGTREPEIYGGVTLEEIDARIKALADELGVEIHAVQFNHEGEVVEAIHACRKWAEVIIINPAALTHYSIAVRDALLAVGVPAIEVHISNPEAREEFRHYSVIADIVAGRIAGFGANSYLLALRAAHAIAQEQRGR